MRRFFFLLLILLTYYLAGMYRSLPLLILCAAEFLTVIFSFLLTRYFRRKIAASFQKKTDTARAGETAVCSLVVTSASRLPVGRCVLTVEVGFPRRRESGKGKRRLESRAEFGENPSFFRISVPHCGIVRIRLTRIRVYDYFFLFSREKEDGRRNAAGGLSERAGSADPLFAVGMDGSRLFTGPDGKYAGRCPS